MADEGDKPARRPRDKTEATPRPEAPPGAADITGREAAGLVTDPATRAMEEVREMGADMTLPLSRELGQPAAESDITSELGGGGVAFGEFVKSVGVSVAAAQAELDATLVKTAKALSETKINTVAVFEQTTKDDDGLMGEGKVHLQELPLTNYLMPTAYQWSRVYLEADMNVQEFNSRSGFNIQQKRFSADARMSGNYGLLGFGVQGSAGMSYGSTGTATDSAFSQDVAAGKLHMEATLEPRHDVELPRPFVLQKGPRLQLTVSARQPITDSDQKVIGQKVRVTATLLKTDNSPNGGKDLSISISEPTFNYKTVGDTTTNASTGKVEYEIERRASPEDLAKPVPAMVRVSFGLVTGVAAVSL